MKTTELKFRGKLFIVSGPSGVGKGTLINKLLNEPDLNLISSVSMTTRQPRVGETEGVDYFFVNKEEFIRAVHEGELLEHAFFFGNHYGTPRKFVMDKLDGGQNILLEIEIEGYKQVIKKIRSFTSIFIAPASLDTLKERLAERGSERGESISTRLSKAEQELSYSSEFDHTVVNVHLASAYSRLKEIILSSIER